MNLSQTISVSLAISFIGSIIALYILYFIGYSRVMKLILERRSDGRLREHSSSGMSEFDDAMIGLFLVVQIMFASIIPPSTSEFLTKSLKIKKKITVIVLLCSIATKILSVIGAVMMSYIHFGKKYDSVRPDAIWNTILASLILPWAMLCLYALLVAIYFMARPWRVEPQLEKQ